jgi:hypothetical protein
MLTADRLDALTDSISAIYEEYQQSVINDISRRLGKLKFDSAAWQMQRLTESGLTYQNAVKELAKVTNKSEKELRRIFEKAGVTAMEFDDSIYKAAGLNPLPLNLSPAMARVLSAGLAEIVIDNERCPYTAEEFLKYEYETTKNGDVIDEYPDRENHAIDAVRYALNMVYRVRGA